MATLIAFASWLGVGSSDNTDDAVGLFSAQQGISLAANVAPSGESLYVGSSLEMLARTSTPTPAPPPTTAPTAAPTLPQVTPDPVRVPQATAAAPAPTANLAPPPSPAPRPVAGAASDLAAQLAALIDDSRAAVGVPALSTNNALTAAAQDYAALHFLEYDPFQLNHYLDDGPIDRVQREGYTGAVGETLATGSPKAGQLMTAWLDSPPHEKILLSAKYRDVGVGCYSGPYLTDDGRTLDIAICVALVGYR